MGGLIPTGGLVAGLSLGGAAAATQGSLTVTYLPFLELVVALALILLGGLMLKGFSFPSLGRILGGEGEATRRSIQLRRHLRPRCLLMLGIDLPVHLPVCICRRIPKGGWQCWATARWVVGLSSRR